MPRIIFFSFLLVTFACSQSPKAPKDPLALEKIALEINERVDPGFTLRKEKVPAQLWTDLRSQGGYGAAVTPDSTAVIIGMSSFPRNYVYYYRLIDITQAWKRKVDLLQAKEVGERWYWVECPKGRFNIYPC